MDRRTMILVAVCLLAMFSYPFILRSTGLDRYLKPAPRPIAAVDTTGVTPADTQATPTPIPSPDATTPAAGSAGAVIARAPMRTAAQIERTLHLETPLYRAEFSSRGARLLSVELKHYARSHAPRASQRAAAKGEDVASDDRVVLAGGPSYALDLGSADSRRSLADVVYAVSESLDASGEARALTFVARDSAGVSVSQTYRVRPGDYAIDHEVEVRGIPMDWRLSDYSLTTRSWPLVNESNSTDDIRSLRASAVLGSNVHREGAGGLRKAPKTFDGNAAIAAVHTRYFIGAVAVTQGAGKSIVVDEETRRLTPSMLRHLPAGAPIDQEMVTSTLVVGLPSESSPVHRFVVYFGPSEYFGLAKLGLGIERLVDLGWNWIRPFSGALLQVLVWLHGILKNYGLAIVLLATLVRLVLHPLNMMSMKSMRAMQKLQPEMERIKQKYKNDAQAMNAAVMALYKENKVNPAGGCLPMLMQMPLFIALYAVLYNAIQLRQADFVGWIHDLSAPDVLFSVAGFPVRLLPLLMTGSGLLSQWLTPTDPRQAPTMYLMNVMMLVFFYNLPSGLVLYWTVMNLLTALQQWMVLREDGGAQVPAVATVSRPVAKKASRK
jgi:YidC/Oxa1 family membrane protein insertase